MPRAYMPRRVILVGNSLAVTIPIEIVKAHKIKRGDEVAFILDADKVVGIDMNYVNNTEEREER
jgi:antitoxin component of MazEF toxin-antitoxin module